MFGVSTQTTINLMLSEGKNAKVLPQQKYFECLEIDEMYSFVSKKTKKSGFDYCTPETKEILALTVDKRSKKQLKT